MSAQSTPVGNVFFLQEEEIDILSFINYTLENTEAILWIGLAIHIFNSYHY